MHLDILKIEEIKDLVYPRLCCLIMQSAISTVYALELLMAFKLASKYFVEPFIEIDESKSIEMRRN